MNKIRPFALIIVLILLSPTACDDAGVETKSVFSPQQDGSILIDGSSMINPEDDQAAPIPPSPGDARPSVNAKRAYFLSTSRWLNPGSIAVCWENPTSGDQRERDMVKNAVMSAWAAPSPINFTGWSACSSSSRGIRILIEDSGPHVKKLGRGIDGRRNGMVLNFTFRNWSTSCQSSPAKRDLCITSIAVHEFGHAIGFAHEQNRPDTPGECANRRQGSDGDRMLTSWDLHSVMNYCNPVYANDGILSRLDLEGLLLAYPPSS